MWGEKKAQVVAEDDKFTFLGKGTSFKGIVSFDGTVRIDGRVEGEVHTGGAVIIGESAIIKGSDLRRFRCDQRQGEGNGHRVAEGGNTEARYFGRRYP